MLEYIKGTIVSLKPSHIILESNSVGYFINVSLNTYTQLNGKESTKIFVHEVIREDAHLLYGFATESERELFRLLVSVNGIGSNTAIMMFSSLSPDEISNAILNENVNLLKSIKGIGVKTAQRVIIDLKDKIGKSPIGEQIVAPTDNTIRIEALSALVMLGFAKKPVEKELDKILAAQPNLSVENVIKLALKSL
ncbi:MAG TPA: Holliday junction branch migration protein RuvA [Prolixibacteraceae bacterium]|nr:Holliday junction branch migration protein RuvA [Prolixibacteraceae bacterium]HPR85563.1 Holliday junction branch migration protein RuvA [Prolixibacteraceae bacterium]